MSEAVAPEQEPAAEPAPSEGDPALDAAKPEAAEPKKATEPPPDLRSQVTARVAAQNAVVDSHLSVGRGNIYIGVSGEARESFVAPDRSHEAKSAAGRYVEPACFVPLRNAIAQRRVAALVGGTCGKRTTALVTLWQNGCRPIIELPAGLSTQTLAETVKHICAERGKTVGVLMDGVERADLAELAGFAERQLAEALGSGAALILTASAAPDGASVATIVADVPDPFAVLAGELQRQSAAEGQSEIARAALGALEAPVPPGVTLALAREAVTEAHTPESLAARFAGRATETALEDWLGAGREPREVAALAAAATLAGAPLADVDEAAAELSRRLEPNPEREDKPARRFGATARGWPDGIVEISRSAFRVHFGAPETEVVGFCAPHTATDVLLFLWQRLDWEFRRPYLEWVYDLGASLINPVRNGAGVAAGTLFAEDPIFIERDVLSAWARSDDREMEEAAAVALGVPNAHDRNRAPARSLARSWSGQSDGYVRVAIRAFGGLLGAWDPGALAPNRLWAIGTRHPEYMAAADFRTACLMAAGGDAALVRVAVLNLLREEIKRPSSVARAYRILGAGVKRLVSGAPEARESLTAVLDQEPTSFAALAELLASAVTSGAGQRFTHDAFSALVAAVAHGRLPRPALVRLIREMKAATPPARLADLGERLQQMLTRLARQKGPEGETAAALLEQFFGPKEP